MILPLAALEYSARRKRAVGVFCRAMAQRPRLLLFNAALAGENGNTAELLNRAASILQPWAQVRRRTLTATTRYASLRRELLAADGFLIGTGTYWDSWSSLLQRFLEEATRDEGQAPWFGKPAGVVVTMHAVGGKQVVSRLQGVLSTFGCLLPPMSGIAYSYANQLALRTREPLADDLWNPADVDVVAWNVLTAARGKSNYRAWAVDRDHTVGKWLEA